jgi:hypothetical protein
MRRLRPNRALLPPQILAFLAALCATLYLFSRLLALPPSLQPSSSSPPVLLPVVSSSSPTAALPAVSTRAPAAATALHLVSQTAPPPSPLSPTASLVQPALLRPAPVLRQTFEQALAEYAQLHRQILANQAPQRYLTVHNWGGFNNFALSAASGLVLAMLTNRALLVKAGDVDRTNRIMECVDQPQLKWILSGPLQQQFDQSLGRMIPNERSEWRMESPRHVSVHRFPVHHLLCSNFSDAFREATVDIHANTYFLPLIYQNAWYRAQILEWFGQDLGSVYPRIYKQLIVPSDSLAALANRFRAEVVGDQAGNCLTVQVRTTMNIANDQVFPALDLVLQRATPRNASRPVFIYVATDQDEWRRQISEYALRKNISARFVTSVPLHVLKDENNVQFSLAETLVALECEMGVVVSRGSTFGYTIAALSKGRFAVRFGGDGASEETPRMVWLDPPFREPIYQAQFGQYPPSLAECAQPASLATQPGLRRDLM